MRRGGGDAPAGDSQGPPCLKSKPARRQMSAMPRRVEFWQNDLWQAASLPIIPANHPCQSKSSVCAGTASPTDNLRTAIGGLKELPRTPVDPSKNSLPFSPAFLIALQDQRNFKDFHPLIRTCERTRTANQSAVLVKQMPQADAFAIPKKQDICRWPATVIRAFECDDGGIPVLTPTPPCPSPCA